jgi:hypothetical protein
MGTLWKQCNRHENFENSGTDFLVHQWDGTHDGQSEIMPYVSYFMLVTILT